MNPLQTTVYPVATAVVKQLQQMLQGKVHYIYPADAACVSFEWQMTINERRCYISFNVLVKELLIHSDNIDMIVKEISEGFIREFSVRSTSNLYGYKEPQK